MNYPDFMKRFSNPAPHEQVHHPRRIEFVLAMFIVLALTVSLFSSQYRKTPHFFTISLIILFLIIKIIHIAKKGGTLVEDYASIAIIAIFLIFYLILKANINSILIIVFIGVLLYSTGLMLWVRKTFTYSRATHFIASYMITIFMIIFLFAGAYLSNPDEFIEFSLSKEISFEDALYFSTVTVTTVGYGDITPLGINRALAALEAFIGMIINVALLGYILASGKLNNKNS